MNIQDFLGIGIVGVAMSLIFELIQSKWGTGNAVMSRFLIIVASLVVGGAYVYFRSTTYWETILGVLGAASTTYAMFFSGKKSD